MNTAIDEIEEMKTYYPSEAEFAKPLVYIDKLQRCGGAHEYGCVKIVPPPSFRPACAFDMESKQKLPTRFQVLQDLSQGKAFVQNDKGRTFAELAEFSRKIEADEPVVTKADFIRLEKKYWDMVENNVGPRTRVEYAADVSTSKFGSGFGRPGQKIVSETQEAYLDHPWNLNNLPRQENSLMQFPRSQDISGINIPWLYIGMRFSTFCWHYEDLMLNSINYAHWG